MRNLILGTAGHIDHGKTALIKALTGIDTDRLREEKLRGISIDLGFAHLDLPGGVRLGIVDVPGHERFIKNMLAGVGGIDLVLFVVACDEGIMPQTREHFEIVSLLGISHGVFALTKTDLVDDEMIGLVRKEVEELIDPTPFRDAPIVAVSTKTGEGVEQVRKALFEVASKLEKRRTGQIVRLPIDRVFTVEGRGTVVTGTLWSGTITTEEHLKILPGDIAVRVRSIEVHGEPVDRALAGQRTALGLHGVSKDQIERGHCVVSSGDFEATTRLDAEFHLLPSTPRPLRNGSRIRFHLGASEVMGRVFLSGEQSIAPGGEGFCQIRLEYPVVAAYRDRFVIRSYSPMRTIGGGRVLNPLAVKRKKVYNYEMLLSHLAKGNVKDAILAHLACCGHMTFFDLLPRINVGSAVLEDLLNKLRSEGEVFKVSSELYVHCKKVEQVEIQIRETLKAQQSKDRLKWGMPKEELRERLGGTDMALVNWVISMMEERGEIHVRRGSVRIGTKDVELSSDEKLAKQTIVDSLRRGRFQPPSEKELRHKTGIQESTFQKVIRLLIEDGQVVRLQPGILMHADSIADARTLVASYLKEHGKATASELKNLLGTTRKYAVPLLEYLDHSGLTRRDAQGIRTLVR